MSVFYKVINLKYMGSEKKGFVLDRPNGTEDYLFLHFRTPVNILQGDKIIPVKGGTCLITTPGQPHWFESPDCDLVHDWVHFIPDDAGILKQLELPINKLFWPVKVGFISSIMNDSREEFINREIFWEENSSALLSRLLILLGRDIRREKTCFSSKYMREIYDEFVALRISIHANANNPTKVCEMAEKLSLSRSRFTVLYKSFFGVSPKKDCLDVQLAYAKYLLDLNGMKIEAISNMAGYRSVYHFIRQFKSATGLTPGQYRMR